MANQPKEEGNKNDVPGLMLTFEDSSKRFDPIHDKHLLEARMESRIENEIKEIEFSEDHTKAYIEFTDQEDLKKILEMEYCLYKKESHLKKQEINLLDIRRSYLVVKNLESFMDESVLKFHFEEETKETVTVKFSDDKTFAEVQFLNPKTALKFGQQTSIIGCTVDLEVNFELLNSSNDDKELVLLVSNLPVNRISEENMENLLIVYFERNTEKKIKNCKMDGAKAYITFKELSAVGDIIANPPTLPFIGGIHLNISAIPISIMDIKHGDKSNGDHNTLSTPSTVEDNNDTVATQETEQKLLASSHGQKDLHTSELPPVPSKTLLLQPSELHSLSANSSNLHNEYAQHVHLQSLEGDTQSSPWLPTTSLQQLPQLHPHQTVQQPSGLQQIPPTPLPLQPGQLFTPDLSLHSASQWQSESSSQMMNFPSPTKLDTSFITNGSQNCEDSSCKAMKASKILIDVPVPNRDEARIKEYLYQLMSVPCSVKQYPDGLLAEFSEHIDFEELKSKAKQHTFECVKLSMYELEPSSSILVQNLDPTTKDGHIQLFFELHGGTKSVVKRSQTKVEALVEFKNPEAVQTILQKPECSNFDDSSIIISEYYSFMPFDIEIKEDQLSLSPSETKYSWNNIKIELSAFESQWFQGNLAVVSEKLLLLKAQCCHNSKESSPTLQIIPLEESQTMNNWETEVRLVVEEAKSGLVETSFPLCEDLKGEILQRALSAVAPDLIVKPHQNSVIIFGSKDKVNKLESELKEFVDEVRIDTEEHTYSCRHIKFLKSFSTEKLNHVKTKDFRLIEREQKIFVKGNRNSRETFWCVVNEELQSIQEKYIVLKHQNLCLLLNSVKGIKKIEQIINAFSSITYYIECSSGQFLFYFLCRKTFDEEKLREIKKKFKKLLDVSTFSINRTELEVCETNEKWKVFVHDLVKESFIHVAVDSSACSIVIVGEKSCLNDVGDKIKNYLADECSIEVNLKVFTYHEWKVISSSYKQKIHAIQQDFKKKVKISLPQKFNSEEPVVITLKGDPTPVDNVRTRLELLKNDVFHKKEHITNIPAARQLVDSIQDKVRIMEQDTHTSVTISVEATASDSSEPQMVAEQPTKVFSAILSNNEVRLTVYLGNFTQNVHNVDTIFNFVATETKSSDINLGLLFSTTNGHILKEEFQSSKDSMFSVSPGEIMKMKHSDGLKCTNLWHLLNYPWNGGSSSEDYFLGLSIEQAITEAKSSVSILFSSPCTKPLEYPAEVFAKKLIASLSSVNRELNVAVYINDPADAGKLKDEFANSGDCQIIAGTPTAKTIPTAQSHRSLSAKERLHSLAQPSSSPLLSVTSLENKSLVDTKAEVYINSTNQELKLKQGMVSNILLKKCGDQLQQECSQCAPLHHGEVAVTGAQNLECKLIFHVNLPRYREQNALQIFKRTIQAVLRKAEEKSIESIAIPSLGVGNLGYPAHISASAIFDEITEFLKANPKSKTKYILVIYDSTTFDEFQKVYQQKTLLPQPEVGVAQQNTDIKGIGSTVLSIVNSDIADEDCDAIVNTTTRNFALTHTAVSKAIMRKGGYEFQQYCEKLVKEGNLLKEGSIFMTNACGHLNCKKVIHANVPGKAYSTPFSHVYKIVTDSLVESEKLGMTSIAFPAFGLGKGQFSVNEIAKPMLSACLDFGKTLPKSIKQIKIVIFESSQHSEFYDYFLQYFGLEKSHGFTSYLPKFFGGSNATKTVNLQDPSMLESVNYQGGVDFSVCFDIYGPSSNVCTSMATSLRQLIKDKCMDQPICHPVIANLSDEDKKEIEKVGMDKVKISVMREIKKIKIAGPRMEVIDSRGKIYQILNEVQKVHETLQTMQWKSCSADYEIEYYPYEISCKLERAYKNDKDKVIVVIDNMKSTIDLKKLEDTCHNSGIVRKVVREVKPQVPSTWVPQMKGLYQYEVIKDSQEYQTALQGFHATIKHNVKIVKLERIQNPTEYFNYRNRLELIKRKHPHKNVDVKTLFHGSREDSVTSIISTGFNRNFAADANAAVFGCGTYFALHAEYSAKDIYSQPNGDGVKFMFICSMVIGEYTKGNRQMKLAPALPNDPRSTYDTLVNDKDNPTIFVAMSDGQAYPNYLVSFKIVV